MHSLVAYRHRGGETPLLGIPIGDAIQAIALRFPDQDAVVSLPQQRRLSYAALMEETSLLARGLMALGIEAGERVGVWATNNLEWVLLQVATARVGAVLVNVNPANRQGEFEHVLQTARLHALVFMSAFRSSDYLAMALAACPEAKTVDAGELACAQFPDLRHLVVFDPDDPVAERPAPGVMTWQEVLERGASLDSAALDVRSASLEADDPINIQFTSGTTGFPKPVVLTHHNILNNGYFIGRAMQFTSEDRLCVPLPFYHCFGMVVANLACLSHGAAIVIPAPHFEAGATLEAIQSERCTAVHGVPTMFVAELDHPDIDQFDLSSLRTGIMAGAPCPPELVRQVMERMGCREILIAYGQTEASPVTHITRPDDAFERRIGTVGTNLPHQEVKVVDPATGAIRLVGQAGELCFRGHHVMRGYFELPEATAETIDKAGWLHSGDLGVMDENGYVRITGRLKDMIIRGGENIYPAEIEALLFQHPAVAQVAVVGVPDARMGEEIAAWIQLHERETLDPDDLRAWARDRMAHYKVPHYVRIVNAFPMTVTGKIQKFRIRELMTTDVS